MALFRLDGKVAFITGAGSGIGEQVALLFARQGATIAIADVNPEGGQRVVAAITGAGGTASFHQSTSPIPPACGRR